MIQAIVDITIDPDFGYTKALKIANQCFVKKLYGNSEKRILHILLLGDIEEGIKCLSSIKGFFNIYLRLVVKIAKSDDSVWRKIGIKSAPKGLSKRFVGYMEIENHVCLVEKTAKNDTFLVKVLKTKNLPAIIEPSVYLIYGDSTSILNSISTYLRILQTFTERVNEVLKT
ncbi:MAG: hypothetical protein QW101_03685 [Ignisphaera sp.]|uniref:Uncharacterized protein n=1 Tax=Ignisphaera aggregans TaxID=334771 RepID=A0A7J3MYP9_9CREN